MTIPWMDPRYKQQKPDTFVRPDYQVNARENLAELSNFSMAEQKLIREEVTKAIRQANRNYMLEVLKNEEKNNGKNCSESTNSTDL